MTETDKINLMRSIRQRETVFNMDADAQNRLLMSTADTLPDGHPLKAKIRNVVERMCWEIYLPTPDGTIDPDTPIARTAPEQSDVNLNRDWLDALVACRNRIV